jgi:hypothetical protein
MIQRTPSLFCATMHTGVISFCDRIAYNIKSSDTKDEILQELQARFQINILQKHWQRLDAEGVSHLYRTPYFACLRSNGNPYFVYFTRYEDVPIIYFVDKKIQPGYQKPRIILGRGKWDDALFDNTVVEGEMVKDTYGGWMFLINDVIAYKNEYLWRQPLPQRLEVAYKILHEQYVPDLTMDVCRYQVKRYAHSTQSGISALMELSKTLPYTSRGIYFWPFSRKFKPKLYNFDDTLIKAVSRKVKDNPEFREGHGVDATPPPPMPASPPLSLPDVELTPVDAGERVMWLRKTEHPDVYDVYETNHGMAQGSRVGIAHVPTLRTSKMLREVFKEATVAMYMSFVCTYDEKVQKWLPVRKVSTQYLSV